MSWLQYLLGKSPVGSSTGMLQLDGVLSFQPDVHVFAKALTDAGHQIESTAHVDDPTGVPVILAGIQHHTSASLAAASARGQ